MEKFAVMANISLVLGRARDRFFPQLGWLLLPTLVLMPVFLVFGLGFGGVMYAFFQGLQFTAATGDYVPPVVAGGGIIVFLVVFVLIVVLFFSWYNIYASRIGTQAMLGEPLMAGEARRRGFNRMLSSLLVSILITAAYAAAYLILILVTGVFASFGGFGGILAVLLVIAITIAQIYVGLGLMMITPVMANEGLGFGAIARSWDLVNGNRWQLLGYHLMWVLILVGAYLGFLLVMLLCGLLAFMSAFLGGIALFVCSCAFAFVFMVVMNLTMPAAYLGLLKARGEISEDMASVFS